MINNKCIDCDFGQIFERGQVSLFVAIQQPGSSPLRCWIAIQGGWIAIIVGSITMPTIHMLKSRTGGDPVRDPAKWIGSARYRDPGWFAGALLDGLEESQLPQRLNNIPRECIGGSRRPACHPRSPRPEPLRSCWPCCSTPAFLMPS